MKAEQITLEPRTFLGVHEVIPMSRLTEYFDRAFHTAAAELGRLGAHPSGPPIALYHGAPTDAAVDVTAGFPVVDDVSSTRAVEVVHLPSGPAVETFHVGPYETMTETYAAVTDWITAQRLAVAGDMWEEYLVGPDTEADPAKWRTRIVFPLA